MKTKDELIKALNQLRNSQPIKGNHTLNATIRFASDDLKGSMIRYVIGELFLRSALELPEESLRKIGFKILEELKSKDVA